MDLRSEKLLMQCHTPDAEFIGSVTHTDAADDFSFSITSIPFQNGDLAVIAISTDGSDGTWSWGGNVSFTGLYNTTATNTPAVYIGVATLNGTETTVATSGWSNDGTSIVFAVFRNAGYSGSISASATTLDGQPNPPSVSGFVGSDLSVVTGHLQKNETLTSPPSGYTTINSARISANGGDDQSAVAMAYKAFPSGTEDPGAFTFDGPDQWAATHIRLIPR